MTTARSGDLLDWVPRGVRLDEPAFASRHRTLTLVTLAQLPVIALVGVLRGSDDLALWIGIGVIVLSCAAARPALSQQARASLVGFALMLCSTMLLHASGGLTDMHIHFYVMLALVALYQHWTPFLLAVAMVAGHHFVLGTLQADLVFSEPVAQENPLGFALLHAGLLLAMAVGLAVGWRYAEQADAARREEQRRGQERAEAEAQAQTELVAERARTAAEAAQRLEERERHVAELSSRLVALDKAGQRLNGDVNTATGEMDGLVRAIRDIALAASHATTTANDAGSEISASVVTMERLTQTMSRVHQIAQSINGIADQTNLLALNATIEAARAAEAGKGFSVVASEVKNLARETAEATDRIREVVLTVQAETEMATTSINRIREVMSQVVEAQTTIATAVEQQTSATTQARQAIESAASEAEQMASDLRAVASL